MIYRSKMKPTFIAVLAIALLPNSAIASFTSNSPVGETQPSLQVITSLVEAPDNGTPDNNRTATPGGTRGGACKQTDKQTVQPLTALVPQKSTQSLTTAEYPVFWFYIPDVPEDVHSIEFSLHEDEKTTLYRTSVQLTKTPGVIGIPLPPSSAHALKLDKSYHWRFVITCDQKETSQDPLVLELEGLVRRVQKIPNTENKVIWHDELTNRAKRYLSNPQNTEVKNAWTELLKAVGLEGLAQAPLVFVYGELNNSSSVYAMQKLSTETL